MFRDRNREAVTETREQEPLLVLVDEFVRTTNVPVLVPDLRGFVSFMVEVPRAREMFISPAYIFHTLRDMVAEGLVMHTAHGYTLTDQGTDEAMRVRQREPEIAQRAAEVVRDYAVQ
jgi:hypothetical protein